jgi:uncharacterized protein YbjT (DUF2867 family)
MKLVKKILKIFGVITLILLGAIFILVFDMRASIPDQQLALEKNDQSTVERNDGYLLFGATRNTGLEVARILVARGDKVTAFIRLSSNRSDLEQLGVDIVVGDALNVNTVNAAFADKNYYAVLSTIGCFNCDPPVDFVGNMNIVDASVQAGIQRMLMITTIGAGDSYAAAPWLSARFLAGMIPMKTQAEEHLRSSQLDYTIIRPGGLRSGSSTGRGVLSEDKDTFGYINRKDLAELIVACFDDQQTIGKTLAAVDGTTKWPWGN